MRPGRLDRILYVGPPDLLGRKDILRIQTRKMAVAPDLDLEFLSSAVRSQNIYLRNDICDLRTALLSYGISH